MKRLSIKQMSLWALFTAFIAAASWVSVPTPFGVNFTMQLFGVCLAGFFLGAKGALAATAVYIAVGAAGLPVFSSFTGGIGVLFGTSGGFLWGFLVSALCCGVAAKENRRAIKITLCILSVIICHAAGVLQFAAVSGVGILYAFLSASLPFLLKDFIIVFLAQLTAKKLRYVLKG